MKRIGTWGLAALGVVLVVWGVVSYFSPAASCRGVAMQPGDVCTHHNVREMNTERVHTYEQRIEAARQGAPTIIVVGALTTGFGVWVATRGRAEDETEAASAVE